MKILSAKKSGKNRVELLLDNNQKLLLAYEIFLKNHLKINQEISDEFVTALLNEDQKYQVKQSALNYISRRPHSKNEIRIKLKQKKFDSEIIEKTLKDLEQTKYLNDNSFAIIFTDEKIKAKNWGKRKIRSELIKRGLSHKIIDETISKKFSDEDEIANGLELARKKLKKLLGRKLDQKKIQNGIYSFLVSRGYDYDLCKQIFEKLKIDANLSDLEF